MLRYRTGAAGSPAGAGAMARHLQTETLTPEKAELARYYAGEIEPVSAIDQLGKDLAAGRREFAEVLDQLRRAESATASPDADGDELVTAAERARSTAPIAGEGGTVAVVRPDMDPRMAERLGLDPLRPPRTDEIANVLNGRRADGQPIEASARTSRSAASRRCLRWTAESRPARRR